MSTDLLDDLADELPRYHDEDLTPYALFSVLFAILAALVDFWPGVAFCLLAFIFVAAHMYRREQRWRAGTALGAPYVPSAGSAPDVPGAGDVEAPPALKAGVVLSADEPMSPREVGDLAGLDQREVQEALDYLVTIDAVERIERGQYRITKDGENGLVMYRLAEAADA